MGVLLRILEIVNHGTIRLKIQKFGVVIVKTVLKVRTGCVRAIVGGYYKREPNRSSTFVRKSGTRIHPAKPAEGVLKMKRALKLKLKLAGGGKRTLAFACCAFGFSFASGDSPGSFGRGRVCARRASWSGAARAARAARARSTKRGGWGRLWARCCRTELEAAGTRAGGC